MNYRDIISCLSVICILFAFLICSDIAQAKSIGLFLNENGEYAQIDMESANILSQGKLDEAAVIFREDGNVAINKKNKQLIIVDSKKGYQNVLVYSLETFELVKRIEIDTQFSDQANAVRVFVNSSQQQLYVIWFNRQLNDGAGGHVISVYSLQTLEKITEETNLSLSGKLFLSDDENILYSINTEDKAAQCDIYDLKSYGLVNSIDLGQYIDQGAFGWSVSDYKVDKLLFVENMKKTRAESNDYHLFVLNLNNLQVLPKTETGEMGDAFLFPRGTRIAFNEKTMISSSLLSGQKSTGTLQIYDVLTGLKKKSITFNNSETGYVVGITPDESMLIYSLPVGMSVIDLDTYLHVRYIQLSQAFNIVIFYEQ